MLWFTINLASGLLFARLWCANARFRGPRLMAHCDLCRRPQYHYYCGRQKLSL